MSRANEFVKVYLPIFGVVLYFSGFIYINEYFRFFGITGFYTNFSPIYLGFFSFSVFHELAWLKDIVSSIRFGVLVVLLFALYALPDLRLVPPSGTMSWLQRVIGASGVALMPVALRIAVAGVGTFLILFNVSGRIGYLHGCEKLSLGNSSIRIFGLNAKALSQKEKMNFEQLNVNGKLTEIWTDKNFVYVGQKIDDCDSDARTTFRLNHEQYDFFLTSKLP